MCGSCSNRTAHLKNRSISIKTFQSNINKYIQCNISSNQVNRKTSQTDKHSIKSKAGTLMCCKEIKITATPN